MSDLTSHPDSLMASDQVTAAMLGRSPTWFAQNVRRLEDLYGFPPKDPAVGLRSKDLNRDWVNRENRRTVTLPEVDKEDLDAFS